MNLLRPIALASLSLAWLVNASCSETPAAAAPSLPAQTIGLDAAQLSQFLQGKLQRRDPASGQLANAELPANTEYLVLYFSAHWCPPCREFTPKLVEWYNKTHSAESNWDLVFISWDHTKEAQEEYVTGDAMPWLVLDYDQSKAEDTFAAIRPPGIPATALITRDGQVLAHSMDAQGQYHGPNIAPEALEKLLQAAPAIAPAANPAPTR